jgi:hypothetical protein
MAFLNGMKDLLPIGCQLLQTIAGWIFKYLSKNFWLAVTWTKWYLLVLS